MRKNPLYLFGVVIALQLVLWLANRGLTGAVDLGEAFCVYNAGKNFDRFGLLELKGLQDDATGPEVAAHPHSYTHQPMFPVYLSYGFHRMGLKSFAQQSFAVIPFFLLGIWFCFLFLKRRFNDEIALWGLALTAFDLVGTLSWGSHLFRAFSWPLFWGAFLAKERWQESLFRTALLLGTVAVTFYFEWSFAGVVLLSLWIDESIRDRKFPTRLFWWAGTAGAIAIALRLALVGNAIGWNVLLEDFRITLSNRFFGVPTWTEVQAFYEKHHFSFWGFQTKLTLGFLADSVGLFYDRVNANLGFGTLEINLALAVLWFGPLSETLRKAFQFYFAIFLAVAGLWLFSPLYVHHAYIHPFFPLFVFPLNFGKVLFLISLAEVLRGYRQWILRAGVVALLVGFGFQLSRQTWFPLPSSQELGVARGKSVLTNYHGWYAAAMTGGWAGTSWGRVSEGSKFFHKHYVLERDKNPNGIDRYDFPDFVLCVNIPQVNPCSVDGDFFKTYPLVREGRGFALFDVRSRATLRPLQREGRWVVADAEWARGRQIKTVVPIKVEHPLGRDERGRRIIDDDPTTGWRLELPQAKRLPWGILDPVLETTVEMPAHSEPVNVLAIQASQNESDSFFQSLRLLGSSDRDSWEQITFLIRPAVPNPSQWTTWEFDNEKFYPYLRLVIAPAESQTQVRLAEIKWAHVTPRPTNVP